MTSNLGSHLIQDNLARMTTSNVARILEETREELLDLLKKTIRPEFLNRIDDTIIFTPLNRQDIRQIVKLQFDHIADRVKRQDFELKITEEAVDWLANVGYDPQFGARPVKRLLQKYVLNELSRKILAGNLEQNKPVWVDVANDELIFRN
jgi:ATP-dependent Clp protease ATP-binding subunit ClpB